MGVGYVVLSFGLGIILTLTFGFVSTLGSGPVAGASGQAIDIGLASDLASVPFVTIVGLVISTPVYMLFVFDKNAGVVEYLLAVGMDQKAVFKGYLRAALYLSLAVMVPMVLLKVVFSAGKLVWAAEIGGLALITGVAEVAFVTVLMTAFSSMQRKPTGMNSPLGISIGVFVVVPELLLGFVLGSNAVILDLAVAAAVGITSLALLSSLGRLITREKLLP